MSRYLVVIEHGERNHSAFVPDLPGCVATGRTREEVIRRMGAAIEMHLAGLREDGVALPEPVADVTWIDVDVTAPAAIG